MPGRQGTEVFHTTVPGGRHWPYYEGRPFSFLMSKESHHSPARRLIRMSQTDRDDYRETGTTGTPRYSRRLSDKILIAFDHVSDQGDLIVAEQLLGLLETMLRRRPTVRPTMV
jgi:hypothetical protein